MLLATAEKRFLNSTYIYDYYIEFIEISFFLCFRLNMANYKTFKMLFLYICLILK